MAPTIHLVRHAQGFHNLSVENESLHDPDLTPLGEDQCRLLSEVFGDHERLTRLVASPLRRTLYTCLHGFGGRDGAPLPVVALDVLQEVSANPCDVGTAPEQLAAEFGDRVDLRRVDPGFVDKGPESRFEPTLEKLTARAREGRLALRDLAGDLDGDDHIVAVSHGGFLHFLTDDYYGVPSGRATGWENCEYRSYQFVDPTGQDEDATIKETPESWRRRYGKETAPTLTELKELRPVIQKRILPYLHING